MNDSVRATPSTSLCEVKTDTNRNHVRCPGRCLDRPDLRIEDINFSVRVYNCLKKSKLHTLRDLASVSEADLKTIRNLGVKSMTEIRQKLDELGFALASESSVD